MATPDPSRRRVLQAAGVAALLAGCAFARGRPRPVTPAPVPTDTATMSPPPSPAPVTADDFEFEVTVRRGFTEAAPGRLEIAFRNVDDRPLIAVGQRRFVLPFVDDDYAGEDASGRPRVFLAPDDSSLTVKPRGTARGPVGAFLPGAPRDGCWALPFEWPDARVPGPTVLRTASVQPADAVRHGYGLYFIESCVTGTVTFENGFGLATGAALRAARISPTRLGFDLAIAADGRLAVEAHDPVVERARAAGEFPGSPGGRAPGASAVPDNVVPDARRSPAMATPGDGPSVPGGG